MTLGRSTDDAPTVVGLALMSPGIDRSADRPDFRTAALHLADVLTGSSLVLLDEPAAGPRGELGIDPLTVAAFLAPLLPGTSLVPTVECAYWEPFFAANLVATLDHSSSGHAGWSPLVRAGADAAARMGATQLDASTLLDFEAEFVDAVRQLWDSWEDDAVIKDGETGLFFDVPRLHHIDFVGTHLRTRGPGMTPRPPQGAVPTVMAVVGAGDPRLATALDLADVLRLPASLVDDAVELAALLLAVDSHPRADRIALVATVVADDLELTDEVLRRRVADASAHAELAAVVVDVGARAENLATVVASGVLTAATADAPTLRTLLGLPRPINRFTRMEVAS